MSDSLSPELLARYASGNASAAERAEVDRWASEEPARRAELARLAALWQPRPTGQWDVDRAWGRVAGSAAVRRGGSAAGRRWALAAAALLVAGAALVWQATGPEPELPERLSAAPGARRELALPDGTRLVLAPGSSLSVDPGYGRPARVVRLEGEAWFEVAHDARHPFRVHAAGTVTEDLGTRFAVRAWRGEPAVRVVLLEGSASFAREGGNPPVVLLPGQVGELAEGAVAATISTAPDAERLVGWRDGRLEYEDAPLAAVLAELGRWYAVEFRLADPRLGERRITHTFDAGNLADALEVLRLSLGVATEREGRVVTLAPEPR